MTPNILLIIVVIVMLLMLAALGVLFYVLYQMQQQVSEPADKQRKTTERPSTPWSRPFRYAAVAVVGLIAVFFVFQLIPDGDETDELNTKMEEGAPEEDMNLQFASLVEPAPEIPELDLLTAEAELEAGKVIFNKHCVACHREDGGGLVGPNLTDDFWIHGPELGKIYYIIENGVPEKGMAPWGNQLSPEEMQQVASYVVSLRGTQPEAPKAPQGKLYRAPENEWVFASNEDSGELSILTASDNEIIAHIPVGRRPRGVRVSPDGTKVYVALSGSPKCPPSMPEEECEKQQSDKSKDGIAEVDIASRKLLRVLPGGSDPEQFDISPDGTKLFVSNEDADMASIVDIPSGKVIKSVDVGREPEGVKVSPDGSVFYVTGETDHNITVVDAESGEVKADIKVGKRPRDVIFNDEGTYAFVSGETDGTISVIDVAENEVISSIALPEKSRPMGQVLSPDNRKLYVANGRAKTVLEIDLATQKVSRSVEVGVRPWGITLSTDGQRLYTANGPSDDITVVDVRSFEVMKKIPAGDSPWGMAIGPNPEADGAPAAIASAELTLDIEALVAGGDAKKGAQMFNAIYGCAHCHGTNAKGHTDNRNLRNLVKRYGNDAEKVFNTVMKEGRNGTAMPPWDFLNEKQTNSLKAFVFSLQEGY
ncbi:MAG: glutaminyl-peptide cyclotransferase [Cyclobacteriaceae bacterium]